MLSCDPHSRPSLEAALQELLSGTMVGGSHGAASGSVVTVPPHGGPAYHDAPVSESLQAVQETSINPGADGSFDEVAILSGLSLAGFPLVQRLDSGGNGMVLAVTCPSTHSMLPDKQYALKGANCTCMQASLVHNAVVLC